MIVISNLSQSYIKEVDVAQISAVVGGYYYGGYYGYGYSSYNNSDIDITQVNYCSYATQNSVGSVSVYQG